MCAMLRTHLLPAEPVIIRAVDVLRIGKKLIVRSTADSGVQGYALANDNLSVLLPILRQLVIPYFIGKDARDLEILVEGVFTHGRNYKFAGMPFWNCVSHVEFSLLDLLGKMAQVQACVLFGDVLRQEIPVYLSSLRRDTSPEEEVDWLAGRLAETSAEAIKIKIGGRMSKGADAAPERTEKLVALARRRLGDDLAIYVDANGSYDDRQAIAVGSMLEAHGVNFFEEPCPYYEYEQTRAVAEALDIPVVGGEQDSSLSQFRWMIRNRVIDMVQPDLLYNGGLIRCLQVAGMAADAGMKITPHSPKADPTAAYMLHFAAVTPNLGPHQEYRAEAAPDPTWYQPALVIRHGKVALPPGPGLGFQYDEAFLNQAVVELG